MAGLHNDSMTLLEEVRVLGGLHQRPADLGGLHQRPAASGSVGKLDSSSLSDRLTLPYEVWRGHVIPRLRAVDKNSLRASCKSLRALVDAMVTSARLQPVGSGDAEEPLAQGAWQLLTGMPRLQHLELGSHSSPLSMQWLRTAMTHARLHGVAAKGSIACENPGIRRRVAAAHPGIRRLLFAAGRSHRGAHTYDVICLLRLLPNLRAATFVCAPPHNVGMSLWQCCEQLAELQLDLPGLDAETVAMLEGLKALRRRLTVLHVTCEAAGAFNAAPDNLQAAIVPLLLNLQRLHWGLPWSWEGLARWAAVAAAWTPVMTSLFLGGKPFGSLEQSAPLALGLSVLTELRMPGVMITDTEWANVLAQLPGLADVEVEGLAISDAPPALLPSVQRLCITMDCSPQALACCLRGMPGLADLRVQRGVRVAWDGEPAAAGAGGAALVAAEQLLQERRVRVAATDLWIQASSGLPLQSLLADLAAVDVPLLQLGRRVILAGHADGDDDGGGSSVVGGNAARSLVALFPLAEAVSFQGVAFNDLTKVVAGLQALTALSNLSVRNCRGLSTLDVYTWACALSLACEKRARQAGGSSGAQPQLCLSVLCCAGIGKEQARQLMSRSSLADLVHPRVALVVEAAADGSSV